MLALTTVHATGVNWDAVIAISCSVVVAMSIIIAGIGGIISSRVTAAINRFRIEVVNQLDLRLTAVESKLEDVRGKQNQQMRGK